MIPKLHYCSHFTQKTEILQLLLIQDWVGIMMNREEEWR